MKNLLMTFVLFFISYSAYGQLKLDENFNYTAGDSIGAHGWVANSGGSTNRILVTSSGLTYAEYPLSGMGNAASLTNNGQDAYKNLSSIVDTSNANAPYYPCIYVSCMVKFTAAQRPGDYFLAFLPSNSSTFYSGRVSARLNGGALEFGLTKASLPDTNTMVWAGGYSLDSTYLLVLKYKFIPGTVNDEVSLFVFSKGLPVYEPAPTIGPMSFSGTSTDAINIGRIALRQGTNNRAPTLTVDGIHAATSWFSTVVPIRFAVQGLVSSSHNGIDTVVVYLRDTASAHNIVDSALAVATVVDGIIGAEDFSILLFQKASPLTSINILLSEYQRGFVFHNVPSGKYYLDVRYRHFSNFRNGIETWSKAGGENFTRFDGQSYDFTTDASKVYGNNQVLIDTVYAFYNGDTDQNGTIDLTDVLMIFNNANTFVTGYVATDINGDNTVDLSDIVITYNNSANFVGSVLP